MEEGKEGKNMVRGTPGYIFLSFAAVHSTFGFSLARQSSDSNRSCRTGLEETLGDKGDRYVFPRLAL